MNALPVAREIVDFHICRALGSRVLYIHTERATERNDDALVMKPPIVLVLMSGGREDVRRKDLDLGSSLAQQYVGARTHPCRAKFTNQRFHTTTRPPSSDRRGSLARGLGRRRLSSLALLVCPITTSLHPCQGRDQRRQPSILCTWARKRIIEKDKS